MNKKLLLVLCLSTCLTLEHAHANESVTLPSDLPVVGQQEEEKLEGNKELVEDNSSSDTPLNEEEASVELPHQEVPVDDGTVEKGSSSVEVVDNQSETNPVTVTEESSDMKSGNQVIVPDNPKKDSTVELQKIYDQLPVTDLSQPVVISDSERIVETAGDYVVLETKSGTVKKKVEDIGGKKQVDGTIVVKNNEGNPVKLPAMGDHDSILSLISLLFILPILWAKKARKLIRGA